MKVLVFEWLTGGGLLIDRRPFNPLDSMVRQGRLMLEALCGDLRRAGVQTTSPIDHHAAEFVTVDEPVLVKRAEQLSKMLAELAAQCDRLILIGPETGGRLRSVLQWVAPWQEKLISPNATFVKLASSKFQTCKLLSEQGVQKHCGVLFDAATEPWPPQFELPAVLKPDDGAGSEGLVVVDDWRNVAKPIHGLYCVEPYIDGVHLSIGALCGPNGAVLLEPVHQHFDVSPIGHYLGGSFPLEPQLASVAKQLVRSALEILPQTVGYIGFDLVLPKRCQEPFSGAIVEINPRLTSSYLGLRQIYETNLAEAMLKIASGESVTLTLSMTDWKFRI